MQIPREGDYYERRIVQINSRETTGTGSSFTFIFRWPFKNIRSVSLLRGHIPYTAEKLINYDIVEFNRKNIDTGEGRFNGVLRWDLNNITVGKPISLIDFEQESNTSQLFLSVLDRITIKMFSDQGSEIVFGNDNLKVTNLTPGNPTLVTCAAHHGLTSGDVIHIRSMDNGTSIAINRMINTRHIATVVNLTQFTIPIDTSMEAPIQTTTGQAPPYTLGSHVTVTNVNGATMGVVQLLSHPSGTLVVMRNGFGTGTNVLMSGMDNGVYDSDNSRINRRHDVILVVDEFSFVVPSKLSAYPVTAQKTGDNPPYDLGSRCTVKIEKLQTSLDLLIVTTGEKSNLSNRYIQSGPDSMYNALMYHS